MTTADVLPEVGDEVMEGQVRAIVTDIRGGEYWLRAPGREEWPAQDSKRLTVRRTRAEMIAAGEL
ncbi:hypothetical protein ACH4FX_37300 [Streptomyces sp. NPDC018019]|uniref:hypothetical protein n=1 Tax=Streptomyces sp. NPDC018019 TaxID=3365030 RepID=UPI003788CFC4